MGNIYFFFFEKNYHNNANAFIVYIFLIYKSKKREIIKNICMDAYTHARLHINTLKKNRHMHTYYI